MGCEAVIHMDPIQADDLTVSETKKELVKLLADAYPDVSIITISAWSRGRPIRI